MPDSKCLSVLVITKLRTFSKSVQSSGHVKTESCNQSQIFLVIIWTKEENESNSSWISSKMRRKVAEPNKIVLEDSLLWTSYCLRHLGSIILLMIIKMIKYDFSISLWFEDYFKICFVFINYSGSFDATPVIRVNVCF